MLEAVNSVLQTSPLVRGNTEQVSSAASFAANPDRIQKVPQAPYISPYIHMDVELGAVLQLRDSETGDVVRQIPSEATIEARQRFQQQIDLQEQASRTRGSAESTAVIAGQAAVARPQTPDAAPAAPARKPAPQARQIAAFQTAAVSGSSAGSSGGTAVQLFA
jgi:hypothetical protein